MQIKSLVKTFFLFLVISPVILSASPNATMTLGINAINEISIQSISQPLVLTPPSTSVTSQTTYAITTNGNGKKIVGSLAAPLPNNTTLSVTLQAPSGASSSGKIALSMQNTILVSNISRVAQNNLLVTYSFTASQLVPANTYPNTVNFTLID